MVSVASSLISGVKRNSFYIFLLFFVLTFLPHIFKIWHVRNDREIGDEKFDKDMTRLNSIDKLQFYSDSLFRASKLNPLDTEAIAVNISDVVKNKYSHGLSCYSYSENWIAALAGDLVWKDFAAIVIPEDITKYSYGLCSQQTIVFMELLRKKNIATRSIGLGHKNGPGHFLNEVYYKGSWHLYDISVEPNWENASYAHQSLEYYLANKNEFYKVYDGRLARDLFEKITEDYVIGKTNDPPAKKMTLFHKATYILTFIFPLLFGVGAYRSYRKRSGLQINNSDEPETFNEDMPVELTAQKINM